MVFIYGSLREGVVEHQRLAPLGASPEMRGSVSTDPRIPAPLLAAARAIIVTVAPITAAAARTAVAAANSTFDAPKKRIRGASVGPAAPLASVLFPSGPDGPVAGAGSSPRPLVNASNASFSVLPGAVAVAGCDTAAGTRRR